MDQLQANVANKISWLKTHETLIISVLLIVLTGFVLNKYLDISAKEVDNKVQVAQSQLAQQKQADQQLLQTAQSSLVTYQATLAAKDKQIDSLLSAISNRNQVLTTQQATDKILPPSQLASRWARLIGNSGVQSTQSGFEVTDDAAIATTVQLEQIPILTANLNDEKSIVTDKQAELDSANKVITEGKETVTGLQKQITDGQQASAGQLKACQVNARKGKFKWFGIGFVSGFIAGHIW